MTVNGLNYHLKLRSQYSDLLKKDWSIEDLRKTEFPVVWLWVGYAQQIVVTVTEVGADTAAGYVTGSDWEDKVLEGEKITFRAEHIMFLRGFSEEIHGHNIAYAKRRRKEWVA